MTTPTIEPRVTVLPGGEAAPARGLAHRWYFATYSAETGRRVGQCHVSAVTESDARHAVNRLIGDDVVVGAPIRYLPSAAF